MNFGITPDQAAAIVALWRRSADAIAGLDCAAGDLGAAGSFALDALGGTLTATRAVAGAQSRQLSGLADALAAFNTRTVDSDESAATAVAATRRQP